MKKFVLPVAIISMITIAILMMSWCSEEVKEQDTLSSLNDDINFQEKEVLNRYEEKVIAEANLSWANSRLGEAEKELNELYKSKRESMETIKNEIWSFTGDRE